MVYNCIASCKFWTTLCLTVLPGSSQCKRINCSSSPLQNRSCFSFIRVVKTLPCLPCNITIRNVFILHEANIARHATYDRLVVNVSSHVFEWILRSSHLSKICFFKLVHEAQQKVKGSLIVFPKLVSYIFLMTNHVRSYTCMSPFTVSRLIRDPIYAYLPSLLADVSEILYMHVSLHC